MHLLQLVRESSGCCAAHPPAHAPRSASQDLENTVGSWDMYGVEESKRYPGLQAEFFERAAAPLTRRESIVSFIAAGEPACSLPGAPAL